MISLEQRILTALGSDCQTSPWEQLISLFQADREAFSLLARDGVGQETAASIRELADLAGQVRDAIRESYQIERRNGGVTLARFSGKETPIPIDLVGPVAQFLREIDGKLTATGSGRDYEGEEVSEAEVRFQLGDRATWAAGRAKIKEERSLP